MCPIFADGEHMNPPKEYKEIKSISRKTIAWILIKFFAIPVFTVAIGYIVIDRLTLFWRGPSEYRIYIISDFSNYPALDQVYQGFMEAGSDIGQINHVKLTVEKLEDDGNPHKAEQVSSRLAEASDTLMVVGHMLSTQTKAALPNYLLKATPAIPVILTTETNPLLLPSKPESVSDYPVFRMSPTDDNQARKAANFATDKLGSKSFWVVEDVTNPVYSSYLVSQFVKNIQESGQKVLLWSENLTIPSVETLRAFRPDCVFFAGDWSNALILIRQVRTINLGAQIILSDGAADNILLNQGGWDVNGIYLLHPFPYFNLNFIFAD